MTRKLFTVALALLLALTALPVCVAESDLPFVTLDWYTDQMEMDDCQMVNDAINGYLRDTINASVTIHYWGSSYADKISTMISSGMDTGIMKFGNLNYLIQAQRGAFYPLEDMLDTLAPGVKALFSDSVWGCMRVNGHCASQDEVREVLDEFVEKLKANGVETIVAEVQRQLDAWKAAR